DCKFLNFEGACLPHPADYNSVKHLLWDEGNISADQRWVCTFQPSPYFFRKGIDMDDMLASNPAAFKILRAFWKVSFIKFDDTENQAFKDAILKLNQNALGTPKAEQVFETRSAEEH